MGRHPLCFLIENVIPSDAGDYTVAVSNDAGHIQSDLIPITVVQPVSIVSQPSGGDAVLGGSFKFDVAASGTEPISYQWYLSGNIIPGATAGAYFVMSEIGAMARFVPPSIVSNHSGAVISEKVLLDITSPPVIISLTESFSAIEGESVELAVSAVGTDPTFHIPMGEGWSCIGGSNEEIV